MPHKYGYRKYKIHNESKQSDDYTALKEIITRRFKNNDTKIPDLFILDGGKGQLSIIKKHFKELGKQTTFISL
ncbi:MAG: hypothetical protein GXP45_03230 [bacterium]|nr:hypothetical protein [bacterium]